VEADLSRHPSVYSALLKWSELEAHLGDAAAAELNARGSGAELVLARFAERKTGTRATLFPFPVMPATSGGITTTAAKGSRRRFGCLRG
jgi:hypothetical protein